MNPSSNSSLDETLKTEITAETHSVPVGYLLWIFGFTGSHRFYYGRPISGTIYFSTFGLFGIGWLIDAFLIPGMQNEAITQYRKGPRDYTAGWVLLTFFGYLGFHRFYLGKWASGLLYFFTFGLFTIGYMYDFWTLNDQISDMNSDLNNDLSTS
ncbi:MAG: TM2 domain-containing protein [Methylotenera sp.]|nr:TM2 domain-containing protein [Oligoflexia bacterium]